MNSDKIEIEVSAAGLRRDFGEVIDAVMAGTPHIITRYRRPAVVIISARDYELLKQLRDGKGS